MRLTSLIAALIAVLTSLGAPAARAYEAPRSNLDFLQDQRWTQINNRLADQNLASLRRSVGLDKKASRQRQTKDSAPKVDHAALSLGDAASTDLSTLRPFLAGTQLSEEQAAKILAMYNQVAARLDVPYNDNASGIAAFLAGSYAAYTNRPFPDAMVLQAGRDEGADQVP